MQRKIISYINLFWQLIKTELIVYKTEFKDSFINGLIWFNSSIVIFTYIFPKLGMNENYGAFMFIGGLASWSLFESFEIAIRFLDDLEGSQTITYYLTLPIPPTLIFVKNAIAHSLNTMLITISMIPVGSLILWNKLNFYNFSIIKFILIFININLLASFFGLILASITPKLESSENIWLRVVFPLWYIGGAQFPWAAINKFNPTLGYISLINPFLFSIEGLRSSFFGPTGYLPFWTCFSVVSLTSIIFLFIGISLLKKCVDAV